MSVVFFLIAALVVVFYFFVRYRHSHWQRRNVVAPKPTFFIGNFSENWMQKANLVDVYEKLYRTYHETERAIGVYSMLSPQLLILDSTMAKEVFVKNFSSFHDTSFSSLVQNDELFSRNPFFLTGNEWKEKRAEITPAFSTVRIKGMFPLIENVCGNLEKYLAAKPNEPLEARNVCSRFTCDVVSSCAFGADAESFLHETPSLHTLARNIFGDNSILSTIRFLFVFLLPWVANLFKIGMAPKHMQDFFKDLMSQAVKQRKELGITRQDYLDYLLQMKEKKKSSDLEMAANAITFFTDGFETSSLAIACALYELAANKDVQSRLRSEIQEITNHDELMENEYMDFVFTEALRMHPPLGFLARECTEPIELDILSKDKKLKLTKGDTVYFPIWSFHHDEKIFDEPKKFNPDRFSNGALKKYIDDGLFLTFGVGPRTCLGQKFARAQSKACIATIIKNFEIELDSKTKLPLKLDPKEFLTYYDGGIWLQFKKL